MSEPTRTEQVTVDGGSFDLHVWLPPQTTGPGVLLLQEIFGVGAYIKAVAARLAREGYVVGAPDLFWRIRPGLRGRPRRGRPGRGRSRWSASSTPRRAWPTRSPRSGR